MSVNIRVYLRDDVDSILVKDVDLIEESETSLAFFGVEDKNILAWFPSDRVDYLIAELVSLPAPTMAAQPTFGKRTL